MKVAVIGRANSARIETACPTSTGTRTEVATTGRSGADRIFRGSAIIFASSPVYPSGWKAPILGITL